MWLPAVRYIGALQQMFHQYTDSTSRRRFLAAGGAALIASTAGCTSIIDGLADLALGDVNLFNETGTVLTGTLTITDPSDETVLSESFELPPESTDDDSSSEEEEDGMVAFEDVWTGSGAYEITVELDRDSEIQGESTASAAIGVDNTDEEMLAIGFAAEGFDDTIGFRVAESLSGFAEN